MRARWILVSVSQDRSPDRRMIKNPLVTSSNRMDRFLGSSSPTSSGNMNELWEEDLWPVDTVEADLDAVEDRKDTNCNRAKFVIHSTGIRGSPRMIPRIGGSSSEAVLRHQHQSAPVNVPDWSKILGADHRKEQNLYAVDVDMDDEDEEDEKLPPHEYLAREHARCGSFATASVLQGVGLKGRDMSRVRNAVWRQTGFLG